MVFVRDEGSVYEAPLDVVWEFFESGPEHSEAHGHREVRREKLSERSGSYAWVQEFQGQSTRFTMRWTSFRPVGLGYDVLEGPFAGSRFFLVYTPLGERTGVAVIGEFVSPTIPPSEIAQAVDSFFTTEFAQDHEAIRARVLHR